MLPSPVSAAAVSWGPPPSPAPPAWWRARTCRSRTARTLPAAGGQTSHIGPGELDEYYAFNSSGQSGEIRVLGLPSMRELVRIPVFNHCSATGWGRTNESRKILTEGLTPETRAYLRDKGGVFINGDAHHPHLSFTDRTYDGRYLYVNDKANNRVARIRLDVMKTDKIVELPNVSGVHGLRPQRYPRTGYVFANGEHIIPLPNDGKVTDDPKKNFFAVYTAIDGDTMKIAWQVLVDGNLDNGDADYQGSIPSPPATTPRRAYRWRKPRPTSRTGSWCSTSSASSRPSRKATSRPWAACRWWTDATARSTRATSRCRTRRTVATPRPTASTWCSTASSPTVTVLDVRTLDDLFDDKIKPRDCVVAEPQLGLGPLHTAFDGRGNAYTTLFIDSQMVKWNIDLAKRAFKGEKVDPIIQKLDVHYQPGHNHSTMGETREADGKWLVSLNKFSKDRFLNVGPLKPENDQLIDISGDEMKLVHDGPSFAEPHDMCLVHRSKINPVSVWKRDDPMWEDARQMAKKDGVTLEDAAKVVRDGNKVRVYMMAVAPMFSLKKFEVNQGDEVTVVVTNMEVIEDLTHGFTLEGHGIAMELAPQATASVTFTADRPGVHWYYCQWFCHALHMEMSGQMIVHPKKSA